MQRTSEAERQFWLIVPSCERAALHLQPAEKYRSAAPAVKKVPERRSGAFRLNLSTACVQTCIIIHKQ